jgi:outer membrane receptor protein involved in Fe transport
MTVGSALRHRSKEFHSPDNIFIKSSPAYTIADFHATWAPNPAFRLTAFVNNAFGEKYITQTQQLEALGIEVFQAGERRTFGARLNVDF